MKKRSLKVRDKDKAQLAAKRLLLYLNLSDDFERGTIEESVTTSNGAVVKLSERPITRASVERLRATLAALSDLQRQARKRSIEPEEYQRINEEFGRYHWKTVVDRIDRDGVPHFANVPVETSTEEEELNRDLAAHVVALEKYGMLARVRQCLHCQKWFVAKRRHELFCSTPHQQAHWRSLPEVRARKRRYQRDYYRNELSPVTSRHARKQRRAS